MFLGGKQQQHPVVIDRFIPFKSNKGQLVHSKCLKVLGQRITKSSQLYTSLYVTVATRYVLHGKCMEWERRGNAREVQGK